MICCWSHRKKKKEGRNPLFFLNSKQEVDYANNTWDKKTNSRARYRLARAITVINRAPF
jgi:hypothetical protein